MRFPLPLFPAEFEIPDEWWAEAGMVGFVRRDEQDETLIQIVAL
jgi:hypothetical protein